jgi:hypothetical protein
LDLRGILDVVGRYDHIHRQAVLAGYSVQGFTLLHHMCQGIRRQNGSNEDKHH